MRDRRLLMIPGPIELEPEVLATLAQPTLSHVDPIFVDTFGRTLERFRAVLGAPTAQPVIVSGSGTLAMELAAQNLVEPGERVVVVETGTFGDRMALLMERIGAEVVRVTTEPGAAPDLRVVEQAIRGGDTRAVAVTHVDTSTGARADVRAIAALARSHGALSIVDAVCSAGAEELRQDAWELDAVLTGSQKALGAPPGLALLSLSTRAVERSRTRARKVPSLYLDLAEWIPIMQAYEARRPAYFATPPVHLVAALDTSLARILAEGMDARVARHARTAKAFRAGFQALGLRALAIGDAAASTITALHYPSGVDAALVAAAREEGIVIAGGLLASIRATYFRVGHMGAIDASDVVLTLGAIERALVRCGASVELGAGVAAAQRVLAG